VLTASSQDGMLHRIAEPLSDALSIDLVQPTSDETGLAVPTEADIRRNQELQSARDGGKALLGVQSSASDCLNQEILGRPESVPRSCGPHVPHVT
jgi:hypothetical protein